MKHICTNNHKGHLTTTLDLSERVGIEHRSVMKLIKTHLKTETLAPLKMSKVSSGGRPVEYATLNELQETFLITLMRNSSKITEIKENLAIDLCSIRDACTKT